MTRKPTRTALVALAFAAASLSAAPVARAGGAAAVGISPTAPAPSEYRALPVCRAPAPGHAGCLARALAPRAAAARETRARPAGLAHGRTVPLAATAATCAQVYPACLTPTALKDAYFPGEAPQAPASEPQTIALVDAFDDPNIEADLGVYDSEFALPPCTEANGCFLKLNERGESGHPPLAQTEAEKEEAEGWALETATDVEAAHAVCQNCRIVLVEGNGSSYADLLTAEGTAAGSVGASEISNSWGGSEAELSEGEIAAFDHPGTVITASAGDDGYLNWDQWETEPLQFDEPDFPASSPDVVAVGGTRLTLSAGAWQSERVWNEDLEGAREGAGGGGCSLRFQAQQWQRGVAGWPTVGCESRRAVADVAADADPNSGVAVYDSVPYPYEEGGKRKTAVLKWVPIGGTSLASPIVAAMFALAGGGHGVAYPARTLYSHLGSALLHDVTAGGNGECDATYSACSGSLKPLSPFDCGEGASICNAAIGFDGPTGVGTPASVAAFTISGESPGSGSPESKGGGSPGGGEGEAGGAGEGASEEGPLTGPTSAQPGGATTPGTSAAPAPSAPVALGPASSPAAAPPIRLAGLALTPRALAAARHGRAPRARIAFAFTLSASDVVDAALARAVGRGGHVRWVTLAGAGARLHARAGANRDRLRGAAPLAAGVYRLTLAPLGGAAQARYFRVA
jgi:hypothetical protein